MYIIWVSNPIQKSELVFQVEVFLKSNKSHFLQGICLLRKYFIQSVKREMKL